MQAVKFPILNNVESSRYLEAAIKVLDKVRSEQPKERSLKRWMRAQGYLDKESFPLLESLLGFKASSASLTKVGEKFLDSSEEVRQDMVFDRVTEQNEILTKYVFDAIQERLYSTSELYRMLTSYVYPGTYIDLPDFTVWLQWMHTSGRIRVLGIRWAPGKRFEDSATYIRGIDVDDILEEEAEEELLATENAGADAEATDSAEDAPRAEAKPEVPTAPVAPAPKGESDTDVEVDNDEDEDDFGWEPPEDDDFLDDEGPTSAKGADVALGDTQLQGLLQALAAGSAPTRVDARLLEPIPQASALAAGVPLARVREALEASPTEQEVIAWPASLSPSPEQQAENVRTLLEWWSEVDDRRALRADQFGVMPFGERGWQPGTKAAFLFNLGCLAIELLDHGGGDVVFAVLSGAGFYDRLFDKPGSAEALLDELFEQGLGARPDLFRNLHKVLMLARSLRGAETWCDGLDELEGAEVISEMWKRLAAFNLNLETLWIVREMSLFGLLRHDALRELRVVPTLAVRRAAFHLGLLETSRAETLPEILFASRRLTPMMASELEAPLHRFWSTYGAHAPSRFWSR